MSRAKRFTQRGFAIYDEIETPIGKIMIQESSKALCGAHCWIFYKYNDAKETDGMQVNVEQAKEIIKGLQNWIKDAEDGVLTEPVEVNDDNL